MLKNKIKTQKPKVDVNSYGIEFFHIYTDEAIGDEHIASLNYLKELQAARDIDHKLIVMIDNYNPSTHSTTSEDVMRYLEKNNTRPHYWAYEDALIENAKTLLNLITSNKLKRSYEKYVKQNDKYPCSLLTAAWYLTRLGHLPYAGVINSTSDDLYLPPDTLINILPSNYKPVEERAWKIIKNSPYTASLENIQDIFFEAHRGRQIAQW